jgi:starch phosphorylase
MQSQGNDQQDMAIYTSTIAYASSGLQGLSLRVLPKHSNLSNLYSLGLVLWA